jgi:ribonuclease E
VEQRPQLVEAAAPVEAEKPTRSRSRKKVVPITEAGEAPEPVAAVAAPEAPAAEHSILI